MGRAQRSFTFSCSRVFRCARRIAITVAFFSQVFYPCVVAAQTGAWSAPSSGYLYDSDSRTIRSVTGFIGSAVLGPSVTGGIDWASLAPNQKYAIAEQNGSQVWIPDLASGGFTQVLDRIPPAHQAFFGPTTRAAVPQFLRKVTSSSGLRISVRGLCPFRHGASITTCAQAVRTRPEIPGAHWCGPGGAFSQQILPPSAVLLASYSDETWQVWIASRTAHPLNVAVSGSPVAAAIARESSDVFVADVAGHRIVQIRNSDTIPDPSDVVSSDLFVNDPTAMVVSSDGSRLFVADPRR